MVVKEEGFGGPGGWIEKGAQPVLELILILLLFAIQETGNAV